MALMLRAVFLGTLFALIPCAASTQALSVLRIKIVLVDAEAKATPVARHALLISDNPPTASPRRIVTALDGTATVRLRPGNYTVESDQPVAFLGKAYQWIQTVDIAAGRDAVLQLTAENAEVGAVAPGTNPSSPALESDPSFLLAQWQESVVALWTAQTRASGFLVDRKGLILTTQRAIGAASSVEVQLTPVVKVAAKVLAVDPERDVAVLLIDAAAAAAVRPVPLGCGQPARPPLGIGQEIVTIGAPLRQPTGMRFGTVIRVEPRSIASDFLLPFGSAGGPVFAAGGTLVGVTTPGKENDDSRRSEVRVVPTESACEVVASADAKIKDATPPIGTHLPVEPLRPFPVDALKAAAQGRAGSLNPYQMSSSDFDVAFITPVLIYGAQHQSEQVRGREPPLLRAIMDFGTWSEYFADFPPVLLVRVTPRLVEGFWTKVARGAARTQGVALPPMKRFRPGFSRLRAFCGDAEVTPIHPFRLEHRVSESDGIYEGLYVFDPGALGPQCGSVKLVLYSEKEPEKGDTRIVDPKVLQQIRQDFQPYQSLMM